MAFLTQQFLGLSLRGFTANIGWGLGQLSQLSVSLVLDPLNGDAVITTDADIGKPVYFSFYQFNFAGLLQSFKKKNDTSGINLYEAIIVDPREILDGTQVILGGFNGTTQGVPNLINPFGYWENQAYGASLAGEGGMPWYLIRDALVGICNQPFQTDFGGPLTFRGVSYSLDLTQLPEPPLEYRIGSHNVTLLEVISQICEDGGFDFFVELSGFTIRVRTQSRINSPPLGTINALVSQNDGTVMRSEDGLELRNEITSSFLVGGDVTTLYLTNELRQFWGLDIDGNPILDYEEIYLWKPEWQAAPPVPSLEDYPPSVFSHNKPFFIGFSNDLWNAVRADDEVHTRMFLNASPVADFLGSVSYECTTIEMRLAQVNYPSWASWITSNRPMIANQISLISDLKQIGNAVGKVMRPALINDDPLAAQKFGIVTSVAYSNSMRMYEFVKSYADEYMGKKFLVATPQVNYKQDSETLIVSTDYETIDAGYLPDESEPLGLTELNQDVFETQDGRIRCFVRYDGLKTIANNGRAADLSNVNPQGSVTDVELGRLFVEAHVGSNFIYSNGPCVELTLGSALRDVAVDCFGGTELISAAMTQNEATFKRIAGAAAFGNFGVKISPAVIPPSYVAVPLKSNTQTYGPWYAVGAQGKVKFEKDPSLTPWNYGGFAQMDLAGSAKVVNGLTNMQVAEMGGLELAGPPIAGLGDSLQTGAPNITNIDVSYGQNGVSTSYRFQTFTPRPYVFGKGGADRFKRLALANNELQRSTRLALKEAQGKAETMRDAGRAAAAQKEFDKNAPKALKRESPHDLLVGYNYYDSGVNMTRVGVSTADAREALGMVFSEDDAKYRSTSVMSLNGLLRPFNTSTGSGNYLPSYASPAQTGVNYLTRTNLDPWGSGNDVDFWAWGSGYTGLNSIARTGNYADARPLALRGPLIVAGWGYDIEGKPVPGNGTSFTNGYRQRSDLWKVGPVDLLWDQKRGVWTSHDVLKGYASTAIPANGSGQFWVTSSAGASAGYYLPIFNFFGTAVPSGSKIFANFVSTDSRWYVTSADCSGSVFTGPI